jgi:hypothetical protein
MPANGLSLVGFMERDQALVHLSNACVPDPAWGDAELEAEWNAAKAKLGAPVDRAGQPEILPIEPQYQQYIAELAQLPWVAPVLATLPHVPGSMTFAMVEANKLLAYQHTIMVDRSNHHCGHVGKPPSTDEMLAVALPKTQPNEPIMMAGANGSSILLKAESLNVRMQQAGHLGANFVGIQFGLSLSLVHVVKFNGRAYLHNGFHRTLGLVLAGATHVPCLIRDVANPEETGVRNDGATFDHALLDSNNPPTLEHFTQGRAHDVKLRRVQRYINVSWAEYVMAME